MLVSHHHQNNFWKKVKLKGLDDYWNWQGSLNRDGYGQISINRILYCVLCALSTVNLLLFFSTY